MQTHQRFLDTIHHRITELVDQKGKTQANGLLDLHLCNLSSRWQQASVTLADKLNALHGREAEIARFNQQVGGVVRVCVIVCVIVYTCTYVCLSVCVRVSVCATVCR